MEPTQLPGHPSTEAVPPTPTAPVTPMTPAGTTVTSTTTTTTYGTTAGAPMSSTTASSPMTTPVTPLGPTVASTVPAMPDMKRTVVVCGATGQQGGAVVDALLATGRYRVRAMTRDVSSIKARDLAQRGCELVAADMGDTAALRRAMDGAYGVFSVQTPFQGRHMFVDREVLQGKNVIDAARATNIRHIVYSSVAGADRASPRLAHFASKLAIEQYLVASGVPYTILRPATFMENWLHGPSAIRHGKIMGFPGTDVKSFYVACADIGLFTELALSYPEDHIGKTIDLAGDWVDGRDLCLIFNRVSAQNAPFKYVPISRLLLRLTAPDMYNMAKWFDEIGFPRIEIETLRHRLPGLRTVEMWAAEKGYATRQLPRVSCDIA